MSSVSPESLDDQLVDPERILDAARRSVREDMVTHKRLGLSVVEHRGGKVVWVAPEDIVDSDRSINTELKSD